ncbi:sigma-70 family RNA polymerase sigma factor [Oscillospiraceae bacterium PP1C4]
MFTYQQKTFDLANFDHLSDQTIFEQTDNSHARARYRRFLANAIRYLPPKQREVIPLYFLDGLKMAEIAQQLGVSKSTVSRRLAAARHTLRELAALCEKSGLFPS